MIRWITETLGTAPAGSPQIAPDISVVDVRDLVDKAGNDTDLVRTRVRCGVRLLDEGHRVVVCCDYGISRSNAIATGILAVHSGMSFDEAVATVRRTTGESELKLEPLNIVRAALAMGTEVTPKGTPPVLVTGAAGFIGRELLDHLPSKYEALSPGRMEVDLTAGALDLDLIVKRARPSCVVHLANPRVYTSARAIGETLTMLRNALDVCRENRIRLIYPSGWEVYSGYRTDGLLADESLPPMPKGPYGEAKLLAEVLIEHYRHQHGVDIAIIRSSPVYGLGGDRPKFVHNFLGKARAGEAIKTHRFLNGSPRLDLLHISDLVSAITAVIETGASGDFNLGTGRLTSTRDVAEFIVDMTGSSSAISEVDIGDHAPNIRMDATKATRVLGWTPRRTIEDGLMEIVRKGLSQ